MDIIEYAAQSVVGENFTEFLGAIEFQSSIFTIK